MKAISVIFVSLLTALAGIAQEDLRQTHPIDRASATIPYDELLRLLDAARLNGEADSRLPAIEAAVTSAIFRITWEMESGCPIAFAEFEAINFSDRPLVVPLMEAGVSPANMEPADARLVIYDAKLSLVLEPNARGQVAFRFGATESRAPDLLEFKPSPATSSKVVVGASPDGREWKVSGPAVKQTDNEYAVVSTKEPLAITLVDSSELIPSSWSIRSELLAEPEELVYSISGRVTLQAKKGSATQADLVLPIHADISSIAGPDLATWTQQYDDKNRRLVSLAWNTPGLLTRQVAINYDLPRTDGTTGLQIDAVDVLQSDGEPSHIITVIPPEGFGLSLEEKDGSMDAPPPRWISSQLAGREATTVRSTGTLLFDVRELARVKTPSATIDSAHYDMTLVADGSLVCDAELTIRHRINIQWKFTLPPDTHLLNCKIGNDAVDPLIAEDGTLILPIKPPKGNGEETTTKVTFTYTAATGQLDPVAGNLSLALPVTPLFINETRWTLLIPKDYEASAMEGNVGISEGGGPGKPIVLVKNLSRGEQPRIDLYYRKRGLDKKSNKGTAE